MGCTSSNIKPSSSTATIKGYKVNDGIALRNYFRIESIDGKELSYIFKSETETAFPLPPGNHRALLYIERAHKPSTPKCPCSAKVSINFKVEPKKSYRVNGNFDGGIASVWIEEISNNNNRSKPVKVALNILPINIYVPIIM